MWFNFLGQTLNVLVYSKKTGGLRTYFFETHSLEYFIFLTLEIPDEEIPD